MKALHKRKKLTESILALSMGILLVCSLLIGLFLSYYSIRYSYYSSTNYQLPVYLIKDSEVLNLLTFCTVTTLCLILNGFLQKLGQKQRLAGYLYLGICCLIYCALCLIWVNELPYYPNGDQLKATAAAHYNLNGNFIMFKETGYLGKFPYQKGLTFLYEILFTLFGHFCYDVAAKMHIILGVVSMVFGYLFVEETSYHPVCKILYCPLVLFCLPYLILTPYTYGDLPSICFGTVLFWALLRYTRTFRARYAVLSCIMGSLSLLMRMHTWVLLAAVFIGMFLVALQKKMLAPILAAALVCTSAFSATKLLDYSYALRSGYEITKGAPMILTLAMGMQNNEGGPGTYNNYQTSTLSLVDYDREAASEIALENLKENFEHFSSDPHYAIWFFKTKILMQSTEPSFEALISTHYFDKEKAMPEWIEQIYSGSLHDIVTRTADRYQSLIYLSFLFFLPVFRAKRKENAAWSIPLITIVGGFLFSIIWEAQCRYVLPYYMFMLLYVPDGIFFFSQFISKLKKH